MARTLLGILQLNLRHDFKEKGKSAESAIRGIEAEAKRLGSAPWGAGFQRQLDRLKVSPAEYAAIVGSYERLAKGINGKVSKADLSAWRSGVISNLSGVRSEIEQTRRRASEMHTAIIGKGRYAQNLAKSAMVAFGAYTLWYGAGMALRKGFIEGARGEQLRVRAKHAGLTPDEISKIDERSLELAVKYGLKTSDLFQVISEASLNMKDVDEALKSSETMAQGFAMFANLTSPAEAINAMYTVLKAFDALGTNQDPEQITSLLDTLLRAQQVIGTDIDANSFALAVRYSRQGGKVIDPEFLVSFLMAMAGETSGNDAGRKLSTLYDKLIGGKSTPKARAEQERIGMYDEKGNLVGQDLFQLNPILWANAVLKPLLEADGVDIDSKIELGKALSAIFGEKMSGDFMAAAIMQFEPYLRTAKEKMPKASGLSGAETIRHEDPFAAAAAFGNSLANVSEAFGEKLAPIIVPALNQLADGINTIAAAVKEADGAAVGLTSLAVAIAAFGAIKVGKGIFNNITSLGAAGPSLQKAAVDLSAAAAALKGGAAGGLGVDKGGQGANKVGWLAAVLAYLKKVGVAVAPAVGSELLIDSPTSMDDFNAQVAQQAKNKEDLRAFTKPWREPVEDFFGRALDFAVSGPVDNSKSEFEELRANGLDTPLSRTINDQTADQQGVSPVGPSSQADPTILDQIRTKSSSAAQSLAELGQPINLDIGDAALERIIGRLREAKSLIDQLGGGKGTSSSRDQVNSSFADFGVSP